MALVFRSGCLSETVEVFCKGGFFVLRNFAKFTGKHLCQSPETVIKKSMAQVFSC